MTAYLGTDLLLIRPNSVAAQPSDVSRPVWESGNAAGNVLTATTAAPAATTRALEWVCETRADLAALRAVLDARLGQTIPLWVPTYQRDVTVTAVTALDWTVPTATAAPLGDQINASSAYRHWFVSSPGGALYVVRRLTASTDNLDGTMTWDGLNQFGTDNPFLTSNSGRVFSRLLYCRMAADRYRIRYVGRSAVVTATFLEVPTEAP